MNIALVDLNLLVVFDAVMREKHVTRAAKRIGMTQPAVSNALNRLRYIAKDDLFVRSASGVVPTSRALELGPPIRQAINLVENAVKYSGNNGEVLVKLGKSKGAISLTINFSSLQRNISIAQIPTISNFSAIFFAIFFALLILFLLIFAGNLLSLKIPSLWMFSEGS